MSALYKYYVICASPLDVARATDIRAVLRILHTLVCLLASSLANSYHVPSLYTVVRDLIGDIPVAFPLDYLGAPSQLFVPQLEALLLSTRDLPLPQQRMSYVLAFSRCGDFFPCCQLLAASIACSPDLWPLDRISSLLYYLARFPLRANYALWETFYPLLVSRAVLRSFDVRRIHDAVSEYRACTRVSPFPVFFLPMNDTKLELGVSVFRGSGVLDEALRCLISAYPVTTLSVAATAVWDASFSSSSIIDLCGVSSVIPSRTAFNLFGAIGIYYNCPVFPGQIASFSVLRVPENVDLHHLHFEPSFDAIPFGVELFANYGTNYAHHIRLELVP